MPRRLADIKVSEIRANPVALRNVNKSGEGFKEMVDSVRSNGIITPISVREKTNEKDDKKYELIDGLHRFTCAQEVGLEEIPAHVVDADDAKVLYSQIIANAQKVETRAAEYAKGLLRILANEPTMSESQLAAKLSKTPSWISAQLGLLKLDEPIQKLVNEGKIKLANAYPLSRLPKDEQTAWVERAMTMQPQEFGPKANTRKKEIDDANRKGKAAAPEQFVPIPHLRGKKELDDEMRNPQQIPQLLAKHKITSAKDAAAMTLAWALNFDPESQANQKKKHDEQKAREKDLRERRKAEQDTKKAKEAADKAAELAKQAEDSKKLVAGRPPLETKPAAGATASATPTPATPAPTATATATK